MREPTKEDCRIGLRVALNILSKWGCSNDEKMRLLGISNSSTFKKYQKEPNTANVSNDLLERISYILNMHKALRTLFTNEGSVYGWVRKPNGHPLFGGDTAMSFMMQGRVSDLFQVSRLLNHYCSS